jgi:hypothetical protein
VHERLLFLKGPVVLPPILHYELKGNPSERSRGLAFINAKPKYYNLFRGFCQDNFTAGCWLFLLKTDTDYCSLMAH